MVKIVVAGLPKNVKIPKFMAFLEKALFEDGVKARLLNTTIIDASLKSITLNMRSNDARKARRYLDGLAYPYGGKEYPLECWSEDVKSFSQLRDRSHLDSNKVLSSNGTYSYSAENSKGPIGIKEELERIDLRIELLKKQRLLMAEENKLLLEKKKLEILQNVGPNDYELMANYEKVCLDNNPTEIHQLMMQSIPKPKCTDKLPNFTTPCKVIVSEMEDALGKFANEDNHEMLMSLIHSTIRKRIVIVLGGKTYLPAADIVHLYRIWYPQNTDSDLLHELKNTISQSCWPKQKSNNDDEANQNMVEGENSGKTDEPNSVTNEDETNEVVKINNDINEKIKTVKEGVIDEDAVISEETVIAEKAATIEEAAIVEKAVIDEEAVIKDVVINEDAENNKESVAIAVTETKEKTDIMGLKDSEHMSDVNGGPTDFVNMVNNLTEWEDDNSKKEQDQGLVRLK